MRTSTPRCSSVFAALRGELVAEGGQRLLSAVDQDDPDRRGLERAELPPQAARGQLPDLAGQFDPGRPGTDHDDGQPVLLFGRVGDHLGHLEGAEDAPPQLEGVVEGLHARGEEGELVVPEVRLGHPGGHDEAVVGVLDFESPGHVGVDDPDARGRSRSPRPVAPARSSSCARRAAGRGRSGPGRACPSPSGRGGAGRGGDCAGRPGSRRPACPTEQPGGGQAPESAADDDHPVAAAGRIGSFACRRWSIGVDRSIGSASTSPALASTRSGVRRHVTVPGCSA